jgi:hypothetical protein
MHVVFSYKKIGKILQKIRTLYAWVTFHIPIDGSQAQDKELLEKIKIKITNP